MVGIYCGLLFLSLPSLVCDSSALLTELPINLRIITWNSRKLARTETAAFGHQLLFYSTTSVESLRATELER